MVMGHLCMEGNQEGNHPDSPSVVTGREISIHAADWAFRNGGLAGPLLLALELSALEILFPDPQVCDVGLVQWPFT